jgi:hypothetical protein
MTRDANLTAIERRERARDRQRRKRERDSTGAPVALCGARTRSGGTCGLPAGWGTSDPGYGRCARHGGLTPSHRAKAARERAAAEVAASGRTLHVIDAGDALEAALAIAAHRMAKVQELYGAKLDAGDLTLLGVEGDSVERVARIAKVALERDLNGRGARMAEAHAEMISTLIEDAFAACDLTPEQRTRATAVIAAGLRELEAAPSLMEGGRG